MNIRRVISILKRSRVYYRCIRQKLSEQSIRENFHEEVMFKSILKAEYEVRKKATEKSYFRQRDQCMQ